MEAHHREAVDFARELGATNVRIGKRRRHAALRFTAGGREHEIMMHRGNRTLHYHLPRMRSLIRRAIYG